MGNNSSNKSHEQCQEHLHTCKNDLFECRNALSRSRKELSQEQEAIDTFLKEHQLLTKYRERQNKTRTKNGGRRRTRNRFFQR